MSTLFPQPRWATGAGASVVLPNDATRDQGWSAGEFPPAEFMNALQRDAGRWIGNISSGFGVYTTLDSFIADAEEGDQGVVRSYNAGNQPLQEVAAINGPAGADLVSVDGDGSILVCTWSNNTADVRTRSGVLLRSLALPGAVTGIGRIVTNGEYSALIFGTRVHINTVADGAQIGTFDHAGALTDVAIDGTNAYIVGAAGTGGFQARAVNLAGVSSAWGYIHGASLNSVTTDGVRVYIGGNVSGGNHIRALTVAAGAVEWSLAADVPEGGQHMDTDGEFIWAKTDTTLRKISTKFGEQLESIAVSGTDVKIIHLCGRYLFLRNANNISYLDLKAGQSTTLATCIQHGAVPTGLYCDGDRIYAGGVNTSSVSLRVHLLPQLRDQMFKRTLSSNAFQPHRGLAYPVE